MIVINMLVMHNFIATINMFVVLCVATINMFVHSFSEAIILFSTGLAFLYRRHIPSTEQHSLQLSSFFSRHLISPAAQHSFH